MGRVAVGLAVFVLMVWGSLWVLDKTGLKKTA
jgi:uncharacterized ion transporter superfamily protein YfcC